MKNNKRGGDQTGIAPLIASNNIMVIVNKKEQAYNDTLRYIGFNGNKTQFYTLYKPTIDLLGYRIQEFSPRKIMMTFCLNNIKESNRVKERKFNNKIGFGEKKLKKSMAEFIKKFNSRNSIQLEMPSISKIKSENSFLVCFSIMNPSYNQQKIKVKYNKRNTQRGQFFCLYIMRNNQKIFYFRGNDLVLSWVDWWLESKLRVKFESKVVRPFDNKILKKLLSNPAIKVYEMCFRHPEIGDSEKIIVKSRKGNCMNYQEKIRKIWEKRELTIYDLDYIRLSSGQNKEIKLNFKRRKPYYISLLAQHNFPGQIPSEIKDYLGENIFLFQEIDKNKLIKTAIHREWLDRYEYEIPELKPFIQDLIKKKIITIEPFYKYLCSNVGCNYSLERRKPMEKKICLCGATSTHPILDRYNIKIDYNKIISLIGKGIKFHGFISYKKMPTDYLGFKNTDIIRIKNNKEYLFILLNKRGFSSEDIENLRLLGIPMLLINLKGEIESTLEGFNIISSNELVSSLLQNDYSHIGKLLVEIKENSHKLRWNSFETSLKLLKMKSITPASFENAVFSLFNVIFEECQRWGGPRLADGSFPLKQNKVKYLLWDAKRYDNTSLLNYVNNKSLKKDIKYMEDFNKNQIIRKFGSIRYYLFVTSNTSKEEFSQIKESLQKQIKSTKTDEKLKRVKVICINKEELINFADYFKENYDLLMTNYEEFMKIISSIFYKKEYFIFSDIKKDLDQITEKNKIYPVVSELRK